MAWFAEMLSGGDRRSLGRSREVAALVIAQPDRIEELVALLDDESPLMKMRAADACEQISFECPDMLQGEVSDFLDIAAQEQPQDVCWRLCLILPRLRLTNEQRKTAFESFAGYTGHESRIVCGFAMQALAELAGQDPKYR